MMGDDLDRPGVEHLWRRMTPEPLAAIDRLMTQEDMVDLISSFLSDADRNQIEQVVSLRSLTEAYQEQRQTVIVYDDLSMDQDIKPEARYLTLQVNRRRKSAKHTIPTPPLSQPRPKVEQITLEVHVRPQPNEHESVSFTAPTRFLNDLAAANVGRRLLPNVTHLSVVVVDYFGARLPDPFVLALTQVVNERGGHARRGRREDDSDGIVSLGCGGLMDRTVPIRGGNKKNQSPGPT